MSKKAVVCFNIGTPDSPTTSSVKAYLKEFLLDKRVLDIPWALRQSLVRGAILPFRSPKSAEAYASIWSEEGSPLLLESDQFCNSLQKQLGSEYVVKLAMRYGEPSIKKVLEEVKDFEEIVLFPLFPQYASSSTGSCLEFSLSYFAKQVNVPAIRVVKAFYKEPSFVEALAGKVRETEKNHSWDHLLMSYHGLPERQVRASEFDPKNFCSSDKPCPVDFKETYCYRKQCYETSSLLAQNLGLDKDRYSVSFQSRLGRDPWIKPYTDLVLPELYKSGVKNLAVMCPAFVADCLETLEEISIRAREDWMKLGGESFTFIPCLNDSDLWIQSCVGMIKGDS